jgi:hypothetical protein
MPVTATLFCQPCLKRGHECPAREGSDECIFCEDKALCPVMQRAVTAHTHERPASSPPRLQAGCAAAAGGSEQEAGKAVASSQEAVLSEGAE